MKNTIRNKEEARQFAIKTQEKMGEENLSYSELIEISENLYNLGKRFGLIKEFKENGLI